jgi:hypothetical protein
MDYFSSLEDATAKGVHARDYFRNLNSTRNLLKHQGLYPDAKQWSRVGESVYQHTVKWCWDYLNLSFSELDEAALITDARAKRLYDAAKVDAAKQDFKAAFEKIALALTAVFSNNSALRGLEAGKPKSEDAIRLAGFGVHSNNFLAMQEFLPHVQTSGNKAIIPQWKQSQFGHPGNWTEMTADFCLRTFVDVAIKIQGAQWIPGAISRQTLYEQQVEAIKDEVEFWRHVRKDSQGRVITGFSSISSGELHREVVRTLKRGESVRGLVSMATDDSASSLQALFGGPVKNPEILDVFAFPKDGDKGFYASVLATDVRVTCVPRDIDYVTQYYSWLPIIDWEPE